MAQLFQVLADDLDGDTLTYSLVGGGSSDFSIDASTGIVSIKKGLDRETSDRAEVLVKVSDSRSPPKSATCMLQLNITDINDNAPEFTKSQEELTLTSNTLQAGQDVYTVTATDADADENGRFKYSLTGDSQFRVDADTGVVTMVTVPEAGNYDLTITATDEGTPALTGSMTLKVTIVKPGMYCRKRI